MVSDMPTLDVYHLRIGCDWNWARVHSYCCRHGAGSIQLDLLDSKSTAGMHLLPDQCDDAHLLVPEYMDVFHVDGCVVRTIRATHQCRRAVSIPTLTMVHKKSAGIM